MTFTMITAAIVLWAVCYNIFDHSTDEFRADCENEGFLIKSPTIIGELKNFIFAPLAVLIWFGPLSKLVRAELIKELKEEKTALTYKEMKSFQRLEDKWL